MYIYIKYIIRKGKQKYSNLNIRIVIFIERNKSLFNTFVTTCYTHVTHHMVNIVFHEIYSYSMKTITHKRE